MPCPDSSSRITLQLDREERFVSFDFAKITCGREITSQAYSRYCEGRSLQEILLIPYSRAIAELELITREKRFLLYLEWEALRSSIAQYLGIEDIEIDRDRCHIISVEHLEEGATIAMMILPPKGMPQIIPCGPTSPHGHEPSPSCRCGPSQ